MIQCEDLVHAAVNTAEIDIFTTAWKFVTTNFVPKCKIPVLYP